MKREVDFKPRDKCIYLEDGGETKCRVLKKKIEKRGKNRWLVMKFKVIENLQPSPIAKDPRKGEIFSAEKIIGVSVPFVLWEIEEV